MMSSFTDLPLDGSSEVKQEANEMPLLPSLLVD
jgi:hypothetical protein